MLHNTQTLQSEHSIHIVIYWIFTGYSCYHCHFQRSFKTITPTMQVQPGVVDSGIVSVDASLPMPGGTLQPVQQALIAKFSEISGMLPQYSQQ